MSLDILKDRIKADNISGVYMFSGSEEYTKDHYASLIRKKVDDSPLPEFNHIYFNAAEQSTGVLEDYVYSLPYMWEKKLIEITDLENARISESDIEEYSRIFSDIPDYLTILIVMRYKEPSKDNRKSKTKNENEEENKAKSGIEAFIALVKDHGLLVEFETQKADKLVSWITRHFVAKGIKFDANVPREMMSVCGSDMYILQSEILKLTEAYNGITLTAKDVHKYCCANSSYKYFDIAAALNRRDMVSAKRILESLDLDRETMPMAVGFLAKNYSKMLIVKSAIDSGKGYDAIEKDFKIKQWEISKIASVTSNTDIRALTYAINQLASADLKLKSFRGNPQRIIELAFYRICTYGRKT